ncbi:MAG: GNAT family N-acetyltransferase [Candidatus Acidiferrales bacterium]
MCLVTETRSSTSFPNTSVEQTGPDTNLDPYIRWLQREKVPIFWRAGIGWRLYQRVLIPASLKPVSIDLELSTARNLLRESGASLIRWHTRTFDEPTSYWCILCERYDFEGLARKARNQIRKANRECEVRRVETEWAAANTYDCYAAAFGRYKHGRPISRMQFESFQRSCAGGPFNFWGAFVDGRLAGFAKCVVSDDYVALVSFRLDPAYSKSLPSYALLDALLQTYVLQDRKTLGNGFLSLHHDTNMQDFLLKFGFQRVYCNLQLAYRPALGLAVNICFPFRALIDRLPSHYPVTPVKSLLRQEEVRRSCLLEGRRPPPVARGDHAALLARRG